MNPINIPDEYVLVSTSDEGLQVYAAKENPMRLSTCFRWYFYGPKLPVQALIQSMMDEYPPPGYGTSFQLVSKDDLADRVLYKGYRSASCD